MPSDVVFFHETTRVFHLITQFSYVFCYCLFFERYFLLLFCGGFFLSLFVVSSSPFIAVFHTASVFNQDVSKWNTGAVTIMSSSKCTLFPSLRWPRIPLFVFLNREHTSHTFCYFVFVLLKRYLFCCLWWVGHSFLCCTPLLQCFSTHVRSIRTCPNGIRGR